MEDPDLEPTRPKPRRGDQQKPPEDRKVPGNNNLSLLIVAVIACVVLAAIFVPYGSSVVIKYGHLEQLIEKGAPSEKNKDPYIDVTETHNGRGSDGPLFEPQPTSRWDRTRLRGKSRGRSSPRRTCGPGAKEDVAFSCSRYGLDQDNGKLQSFTQSFRASRADRLPVLGGTVSCCWR